MYTKKNRISTTATTSIRPSSLTSYRPPVARIVQNFLLFWLDERIDEVHNEDYCNNITKLREVINTVNTFIDADECIDFIANIKEEKVFIIISEAFSPIMIPFLQDISQISCIYIFCENKAGNEQWVQQWSKVKGVFTDIISICEVLKKAVLECDQKIVSIRFVKSSDEISKENLDQLDQSFMYTQILKEILLTIDFEQAHINEFLTYCHEQFDGNTTQLQNVEKLRKEYHDHPPIWWCTYSCFLYPMLNKALRTMEVDLIIKMGFFVRDLHQHIVALHSEKYNRYHHFDSLTVYRGQGLSRTDFDELLKTQGGLLSFNNFLSTSFDQEVSLAFAESNQYDSDLIGVLFKITINPSSIQSTFFADIHNVSAYQMEEEILFSMHSVFRIGPIKQIEGNTRLWKVELTLTNDDDQQLRALTECMQEETKGSIGWLRLGKLMITLAQYKKAEDLYNLLLDQTNDENEKVDIYYHLGRIMLNRGEYANAITFYENALKVYEKFVSSIHPNVAACYDDIGVVHCSMGDYSKALFYYEKAFEIRQKTLPSNHDNLATSYNNIGAVYDHEGEYTKALSYYEKTLELNQKTLPPNHPNVANSYNNIGFVYLEMNEYSKTLLCYGKALEIRQKTLPQNHPNLANSYNNFGMMYHKMDEYSKALLYFENALEIEQKTLPLNPPILAILYNNIGAVYQEMGEYSKALSSHESALQIRQKTLPPNHPDLAMSYSNIGTVHSQMGKYSKALSFHEKAFEIKQKTLPPNHPSVGNSYNNIGFVYSEMGEYSKALSLYEKALEIRQKTLPINHRDLAMSYNKIGTVYQKMSEYSTALGYYEKALEIYQKTFPSNHSNLTTSYNNIGSVYSKMDEYSKALSSHEKALEICRKNFPPNHPNLAMSYENIGGVYQAKGEYSKALSFYEKALEIYQKTLPPNHSNLATSYNNIGSVYSKMNEYSKALSSHEKALEIEQKSSSFKSCQVGDILR